MSGPDLYVFTLKSLALKKPVFFTFWGSKFLNFYIKGVMQLFSVNAIKKFFDPKKVKKNGPQKLLIISPDPFISYYEISGPDICSLICVSIPFLFYYLLDVFIAAAINA